VRIGGSYAVRARQRGGPAIRSGRNERPADPRTIKNLMSLLAGRYFGICGQLGQLRNLPGFPAFPSQGFLLQRNAKQRVLIGRQSTHYPHHCRRHHDRAVIWL
jgi:hypothetical protein